MLKSIAAGFVGTFLALVAVGAVGYVFADRQVEKIGEEIASRLGARIDPLRDQLSTAVEALRARPAAQALDAAQERRVLLIAFRDCVKDEGAGGKAPAEAMESCFESLAGAP